MPTNTPPITLEPANLLDALHSTHPQASSIQLMIGRGASTTLPELAREHTLLIASPRAIASLPTPPPAQWSTFSEFDPNPSPAQVLGARRALERSQAQTVIGLGGGSALDLAKACVALHSSGGDLQQLRANLNQTPPRLTRDIMLILAPTTAGSGAELTPFASLWPEDAPKFSLDHPSLCPDIALVDPQLCASLPPTLSVISGLDAATHAMEVLWGRHGDALAQQRAERALQLLSRHLPHTLTQPTPLDRCACSLAASLAGLALAISRSAAAHALSYQLTRQFHIPHGLAVGLLACSLLPLQQRLAPTSIARILEATDHSDVESLQTWMRTLLQQATLPTSLSSFGVKPKDLQHLVEAALRTNRLDNNLGQPTQEQLQSALMEVL